MNIEILPVFAGRPPSITETPTARARLGTPSDHQRKDRNNA